MAEYLGKNEASTPEPLLAQYVADIATKADRATDRRASPFCTLDAKVL